MTEASTVDRSRGGMGDLHGVSGKVIAGVDGPVQTGSGNQYVTYVQLWEGLDDRQSQRQRWVSAQRVAWLHGRFVEPRGFGEAAAKLARVGIVFLHGAPGSGRRTAAIMLLAGAEVTGAIREISVTPGGARLFDPAEVGEAERLLLDLSTVEPVELAGAFGALDGLADEVRRRQGALAVVLPARDGSWAREYFGGQLAEITLDAPQRRQLLARHLRAEEIAVSQAELDDPRLAAVHRGDPAAELARLAELLSTERPRHQSFADTVDTALAAYRNWVEELTQRFREHSDPRWRALIVTAAMLEGNRIEAVQQACADLLARTGDPAPEEHPLAVEPLSHRLAQIGAQVRQDRVWFTKLAYGEAVLHHVWRELPGLREVLTRWVERVPVLRRTMMRAVDRRRLAERFTEMTLQSGERTDLRSLTRTWAESADVRLVPLTLSTLRLSVFDRSAGGYFRQMLLEWSRGSTSSPNLARVVITVCENVLNESHLPMCLAMLQNLLAHRDPAVVLEAHERLLDMAVTTTARLTVLRRVSEAMSLGEAVAANTAVFGALTAPLVLFQPDGVSTPLWSATGIREVLHTGWHAALGQDLTGEVVAAVRAWLRLVDGSVVDGDQVPSLVQLLVSSCEGETRRLAVLRRIAAEWAADSEEETRAAQREWVLAWVDEKIEDAQDDAWTQAFGEGSLGG